MERRKFVNLSVTATGMVALSPILAASKNVMNLSKVNVNGTADFSKWKYGRGIVLNTKESGANVMNDVHNIAIPIRLNLNTINMTGASENGSDLRFSKPDGTPVSHQTARWIWTEHEKRAEVWVFLDTVKGNTQEEALKMYWGNPEAKDASNGAEVFNTSKGYFGVWHLNEKGNTEPFGYRDSSSNGAHGTGINMSDNALIEGVIAGAQDFGIGHAPGEGAKILIDPAKKHTFSFESGVTMSVWAKVDQWNNDHEVFISKGDHEWRLQRVQRKDVIETTYSGFIVEGIFGKRGIADGRWHHVLGTCNGKTHDLYIDGILDIATPITSGKPEATEFDVLIGSNSEYAGRNFCGVLEEVMVLNEGRDANWAKLLYESQNLDQKLVQIKKA